MLNRLFGNYLVQKKMITQEQLDALLPVPKEAKADISTIAVINKVLAAPQVIALLSGIDTSRERFGDVAVKKGILSDDSLEQLITYQSNSFMVFMQLLLDNRFLMLEQIGPLLESFSNEGQYTPPQMEALILDDLEQIVTIFAPMRNDKLKNYTLTMIRTFRRLVDKDIYMEKAYVTHSIQIDHYAAQLITGDFRFKVYLSGTFDNLLGVANYFADDSYKNIDEDALDNVGEFINCVNGLFATGLSYDEIMVDMDSPEYSMNGPFISNGKLYVLPIHVNGCSIRAVYEVFE